MADPRTLGHRPLFHAATLVLVAGCKVGPDYTPPEPELPDAWHSAATEGLSTGESNVQTWWLALEDPVLNELIHRAAAKNLDLEVAFSRIKQARAVRGIATGERSVDAAEKSVEQVKTLYRTGLTDFQNVLDSERSLSQQQDQLAESRGLVVRNLISLYRALGGGWDPDPTVLEEELEDQKNGEPII